MNGALPAGQRLLSAAQRLGVNLEQIRPLAGDGSDRRFFRLPGAPPAVLVWHPQAPGGVVNENDSYILIGRHLHRHGVPVPEIYDSCREVGWVLLEDLGDLSLETALQSVCGIRRRRFYEQALNILADLQIKGIEGFNPAWCFDTPSMTPAFLLERESGYFLREFVNGYMGLSIAPEELAPEFELLAHCALAANERFLLHRDFQSRNLMAQGERLRLIDFQGARLGPLGYDAASLLIDPYVDLDPADQSACLQHYLNLLRERLPLNTASFLEAYDHLALSRNLQILGAFAFLTRVRGKPHFARSIPPALAGLKRRLAARQGDFPRLARLVTGIQLG